MSDCAVETEAEHLQIRKTLVIMNMSVPVMLFCFDCLVSCCCLTLSLTLCGWIFVFLVHCFL